MKLIKILKDVGKITFVSLIVLVLSLSIYLFGYKRGFSDSQVGAEDYIKRLLEERVGSVAEEPTLAPQPRTTQPPTAISQSLKWSGPELWEAVNKRRQELGVNPLSSRSELCTIASIRLNQLLELGKLDGHEGFSKMPDERPDLKWIFEKYNLSEFLLAGASTPAEAVSLWENTLGHKQLLSGGEYVWGCIYASYGFAVAIAAF